MSLLGFLAPKQKILIVEDDVTLRTSLADRFKEAGFTVLEAGDAHEVLALLGREQPKAIVLDLILPVQDGISLLEELRASGYTMPVVILSNLLGTGSLHADAERLGAQFFTKSATTLDQIVEAVRTSITS